MTVEKTPNQLYKESGTSLSFADWITREKDKGVIFPNTLVKDIVKNYVNQSKDEPQEVKKFDFGIPKWVIISGVAILIGAIVYDKVLRK